jgi:hypothetical protein
MSDDVWGKARMRGFTNCGRGHMIPNQDAHLPCRQCENLWKLLESLVNDYAKERDENE